MVTIRRAIPADLEAIITLRMALMNEAGAVTTPAASTELEEATRRYLQGALAQETLLVWIATVEAQVVASSGLVVFDSPPTLGNLSGREGYIMNMYTVPA